MSNEPKCREQQGIKMGLHNLLRRRNPLTNARMGDSILSSHQKPQ